MQHRTIKIFLPLAIQTFIRAWVLSAGLLEERTSGQSNLAKAASNLLLAVGDGAHI